MCDVSTTCPQEDVKLSHEFVDIKEEDDGVPDDDYDDPSFSNESMDDLGVKKADEPTVTNSDPKVCNLPDKPNIKDVEHVAVRPVQRRVRIRLVPVPTKEETVAAKSEIIPKIYACNLCGDQFPSSKARASHIKLHMKFECPICHKSFRKDSLSMHIDRHSGIKPFKCDVCGKCFIRDAILQQHIKQSHSGTPNVYRCEICGSTYWSRRGIMNHRLKHTGERPYKCDDCPKAFVSKKLLQTHIRVHTGEKPYMCEFCDKRFSRSENLWVHRRVHTNERPYQCTLCPKSFKLSSHIVQHMVVHNKKK